MNLKNGLYILLRVVIVGLKGFNLGLDGMYGFGMKLIY